LFVR
jgi:hypothetical protein